MRGSAHLALAMLFAAGCTRINPSFADDGGTTETEPGPEPATTAPDPPASTTAAGDSGTSDPTVATSTPPATDTGPQGESGDTDPPLACPKVFDDCDAYAEDPCPDGQHCRPWSDGMTSGVSCVAESPIAQPLQNGDSCTHRCDAGYGVDECPHRSICDPTTDDPTCVPLCGAGGTCAAGICEDLDGYGLCRPETCTPLLQDCPDGFGCYLDGICLNAGTGGPGADCGVLNDCQPGLVCVGSNFATCPDNQPNCCAPLCDPMGTDCESGQTCQDYADGVGICVAN